MVKKNLWVVLSVSLFSGVLYGALPSDSNCKTAQETKSSGAIEECLRGDLNAKSAALIEKFRKLGSNQESKAPPRSMPQNFEPLPTVTAPTSAPAPVQVVVPQSTQTPESAPQSKTRTNYYNY